MAGTHSHREERGTFTEHGATILQGSTGRQVFWMPGRWS